MFAKLWLKVIMFVVNYIQKQADVLDYGYLLLVGMTTSSAVLFAVIVTVSCVAMVRRHQQHAAAAAAAQSMSLQGHQATCSLSQLGMCATDVSSPCRGCPTWRR